MMTSPIFSRVLASNKSCCPSPVSSSAQLVLHVPQAGVRLCPFGVYELAFLLFRVKEAAQVEDDGQKEHEAGHGDDRHRLLSREGTIEFLTPQSSSHIHRILDVDTQSVIRLHSAVQLIQAFVCFLTIFAQL